ncbi:MAG: DEAD/DEAH box helicase [Ardenticatenales bacterium]|nr:DEAD/DEAH box helicase [Ardenticatenales bacterium]
MTPDVTESMAARGGFVVNAQPGTIVRARGREWVVQPESDSEWLVLRPLGGTDRETTGLYLPLEGAGVQPATFDLPDPSAVGDHLSGRLLRDAVRLGLRAGAGPFRSLGRVAVEPRPYQLVPLLMALKLDPVRLLIADDVGIGKTVEAGLVARELLDRGEVTRMAVLCPPQLAEQWARELADKFHIEAQLVLPATIGRLERGLGPTQSIFDRYPFLVVSVDFIKSNRYRDEFIRSCPELVIVDEAHTCASGGSSAGPRHLRHALVRALAADAARHLILTTATPHSGDEGAFRTLLALLRPDFADLADDLSGAANESTRRTLAHHFIQRRRRDVRAYLGAETDFPNREEAERTYGLTPAYRDLLTAALTYARERVQDASGTRFQQRVRWWSALALLRSIASSPAAAAATLRSRSNTVEALGEADADALGARAVLDLDEAEGAEFPDAAPGSDETIEEEGGHRARLLHMARQAETLFGADQDAKLGLGIDLIRGLVKDGFHPIVFCRFIPTAEYVADALRSALRGVEVNAVTGQLPPAEREARIAAIAEHPKRVLVATDCLSEGINLQHAFTAVVHYDLSWNPTRHEQREGRVDRYGQAAPAVRAVTLYGKDNQIDGLVLDVLLRKHRAIRSALGVSVPVPASASDVAEALMNGLLLRGAPQTAAQLALFDLGGETYEGLHGRWDQVAEREKRSRTLFAQRTLDVEDVRREWDDARHALGAHEDVERFVTQAIRALGGSVAVAGSAVALTLPTAQAVQDALGNPPGMLRARFEPPVDCGVSLLNRTHPLVEGLAGHVVDLALDPLLDGPARRAGAFRTSAVRSRTTLLVLRLRHHLHTRDGATDLPPLLAEECQVVAFRGAPDTADWLLTEEVEPLLAAEPDANTAPEMATEVVRRVVDGFDALLPALNAIATQRAEALGDAHRRVRSAARWRGARIHVEPHRPVDVLGIYVLLPVVTA